MLHIDVFQDWYLFHAERCSGSDALGFIGFHCWRDAACFPQALASPTCWSSQVLKLPSIGLWEALRSLCSPSITVASLIVAETPGGERLCVVHCGQLNVAAAALKLCSDGIASLTGADAIVDLKRCYGSRLRHRVSFYSRFLRGVHRPSGRCDPGAAAMLAGP